MKTNKSYWVFVWFVILFIFGFLLGSCNTTSYEMPEPFNANVRFYSVYDEANVNFENISLKATIQENEGGVQPYTDIWISFEKAEERAFFLPRIPSPNNIAGVSLLQVNDTLYSFEGWLNEKSIQFYGYSRR